MCHAIKFIETSLFTRQIKQIATDDELLALQRELIAFPDKGDVIQNTGGRRKVRMATGGQGKSSSAREFTFWQHGRLSGWCSLIRKAPKRISLMRKRLN